MKRSLSFQSRASLIAEPGRGAAVASLGLMVLVVLFGALGSFAS
jgi:hypothetical protein